MAFQKGQSGNPGGRSAEKPLRDALRMELAAAERDDYKPPRPYTVRGIARAMIEKAQEGDIQAADKIADRIEGKVNQGVALEHSVSDPLAALLERIATHGRRIHDKPGSAS